MKNKINLINRHFIIFVALSFILVFSFFIDIISFSDKDKKLIIALIIEVIIVEYSMCGI